MQTRLLGASAAIMALLAVSPANAASGVIIAPVTATIDVGGPGFGSIDNTINQAGLFSGYVSGVTNFDTYIASNPMHTSTFACCEWFSNSGTSAAQVTYDFGSMVTIDRLALWNEESSGIAHLVLDAPGHAAFLTADPIDNPLASYPAEVFSFAPLTTRYITFEMSGCPQPNPGSFPACAIGEVAFRTAAGGGVPEPATWAMMLVGFGGMGAMLRSRRRQAVMA